MQLVLTLLATVIPGAYLFEDRAAGVAIEIGGMGDRVCVLEPAPRRPLSGCEDLTMPRLPVPAHGRILVVAVLRDEVAGTDSVVTMLEHRARGAHELPEEKIHSTVLEIAQGAGESAGSVVDVYGRTPGNETVHSTVNGVPVLAYTLASESHGIRMVTFTFVGVDRLTALSITVPPDRETEALAAGDRMIATLKAPTAGLDDFGKSEAFLKGKRFGERMAPACCLGIPVCLGGATGIAVLFALFRPRRRARERSI